MTKTSLRIETVPEGVRVEIRVQPRASRESVVGEHDGALKIALTAPPVDGEANAALCSFVARKLGISKKDVQIVRGETSRTKLVALRGVSHDAIVALARGGVR